MRESQQQEERREPRPDQSEPVYATIKRTSERFGPSVTTIYELVGEGKIKARKLGKRLLIDQASARQFFDSLPPSSIQPSARRRRRAEQAAQRS